MSEPKAQQEPSMEEILASIRKIISEDDGEAEEVQAEAPPPAPVAKPEPEAPPPPRPPPRVPEDVLKLTDEVRKDGTVVNLETGKAVPGASLKDGISGVVELELMDAVDDGSLISGKTAKAATKAISSFSSALSRSKDPPALPVTNPIGIGQGDRTLEDMVRETMRPLIKQWLDANLPGMVERLVQRELERLSRR